MSDADKRQTRQRVLTIVACAGVFALGGPLIAQRFSDQKAQEAYRADAVVLAQSIAAENVAEGRQPARLVSFTNKISPEALIQQAASAPADLAEDLGISIRTRDSFAIRGLVGFTLENLGAGRGNEQEEADCLAEAVYYEARSEDTTGQMAVAEVVMNRVRDPRFPKTVCAVVYQGHYRETGCQFTFTCDGSLHNKPRGESWDRAKAVAMNVMLGLSKPVTNKATHYHTDYVNPYWKAGMVETKVLGTHIFYRFPKTTAEWTTARIALEAQEHREQSVPEGAGMIFVDGDATDGLEAPAISLTPISVTPAEIPAITPAPVPATQVADARSL
ncbi:MAG: cell wall hydrolase [Hyphomonadaceae bacterium]|nr:cell wall hydrolase [Hyphomonadaceae bacterium]